MHKKVKIIFINIIVAFTLGFAFNLSAQKKMSSYSRHQSNPMVDSARIYEQSNPALAFDFIEKALEQAIQLKDIQAEVDCYTVIGNINYNLQQFDLAIENYQKALKVLKKDKNKKKHYTLSNLLAKAHEANNNLDQSEELYRQSAIEAEEDYDSEELKESKKNIANVYQKKGEGDKAIKELEEVRQMDIDEGNISSQMISNKLLIDAYKEDQPTRALELSEENMEFAATKKDTIGLLSALDQKAEVYKNIGNQEEQINVLQQSLNVRRQTGDIEGQSENNLKISEVLVEQDKLDDAIAYLEESIKLSERTGKIETKKRALKSLSSVYDKTGNYNRALAIYKEYVKASDESALLREQEILKNLQLLQSLSKKLQRIDMLENQKALSDKTIELLELETKVTARSIKQQQIIISALVLGIIILCIAIYLVYKSSNQKKIANQLLALRSLRSQMNPHFIFNALNSVNSYISKSDERSANKYLSDFSKLMRAVMENSKFDFVSLASEISILELYLKLEHHRFKEKFDYKFSVDEDIDSENIQIPPMLIQPYIENAIWHGLRYKEEKGYLKVEISNGENLTVLIEDNGIGRKRSKQLKTKNQQDTKSTGLKNINNRLQIINEIHKTNLRVNIEDLFKETETGTKVVIEIIQKT